MDACMQIFHVARTEIGFSLRIAKKEFVAKHKMIWRSRREEVERLPSSFSPHLPCRSSFSFLLFLNFPTFSYLASKDSCLCMSSITKIPKSHEAVFQIDSISCNGISFRMYISGAMLPCILVSVPRRCCSAEFQAAKKCFGGGNGMSTIIHMH